MTTNRRRPTELSAPHTAKGRLQRALLERLDVHEREGTLPTSIRFLFYELVQAGVVPKAATGKRRADQNTIEAVTHLREVGVVPWDWIEDETRSLARFATAPSVVEYVASSVDHASLDRWDGKPAPLILCESRSLAGVLEDSVAALYACPITSTNGQTRGHLISKVAPTLQVGQRVLYLGDWDHCGHQIEAATRDTLDEHRPFWGMVAPATDLARAIRRGRSSVEPLWERVALTTEQVDAHGLRAQIISKPDHRYKPVRYFDAVETEAFGQANIVAALRARLDELMPEPLDDVLERQQQQRDQVAERLRRLA
jgi:hypothetical protein